MALDHADASRSKVALDSAVHELAKRARHGRKGAEDRDNAVEEEVELGVGHRSGSVKPAVTPTDAIRVLRRHFPSLRVERRGFSLWS